MTPADERPWWASGPGTDEVADDPDPVTRHRRARRGGEAATRPDAAGADGADTAGATGGGAAHGAAGGGPADDAADGGPADGERTGAPLPAWWRTAAQAVSELSEDLAAAATANAGRARGQRDWRDAESDAGAPGRDQPGPDPEVPGAGHTIDTCGVCPICATLRVVAEHRPELVGHLTEAARHLTAAVRAIVDEPEAATGRSPDDGLTRIDLDDEPTP